MTSKIHVSVFVVLFLSIVLLPVLSDGGGTKKEKIKVACIGDNITFGARLEDIDKEAYPARLQVLLGDHYYVDNCGVGGCTLIRNDAIQKLNNQVPEINTLKTNASAPTTADYWQYIGIAVEEPGYCVWGCSPIIGPDGKVHLFAERWPGSTVEPGWRGESEIAHYISDKPEGPFRFSEVALKGTGRDTWDKSAVHNPAIHKVGDQYALFYIGNNNPKQPPHPANQCIGLAVSENLFGPWKRAGEDGKILSPPNNPAYWNHNARNGVNNPALLQHPNGGFFLYFKSSDRKAAKMGLAISEELQGPYVQLPFPVTKNEMTVEDGYAFILNGKFCLLTTDNHGIIEKGGGILWKSDDGIMYNEYEKGFHRVNAYTNVDMSKVAVHYGPANPGFAKFERPQVLLFNGKPEYLYVASGCNIDGGSGTVNYVLKYSEF